MIREFREDLLHRQMFGKHFIKIRFPRPGNIFHAQQGVNFQVAGKIEFTLFKISPPERMAQCRCPDGMSDPPLHRNRRHGNDPFRVDIDDFAIARNGMDTAVTNGNKWDLDPQTSYKRMMQNKLCPGIFADLQCFFCWIRRDFFTHYYFSCTMLFRVLRSMLYTPDA